jgi:oxidase EvaA
MVQPQQEGLCAFICKEIDGILHFIVQAKLECGNHDIVEMAPTVQTLTGNYKELEPGKLPFLEYVLNAPQDRRVVDSIQSEEGGRFYQEQNRNLIVWAQDDFPNELPEKYIWLTLNQLQGFLRYNNYLNIQARTLIASLSFV